MTVLLDREAATDKGQPVILRRADLDPIDRAIVCYIAQSPYPPSVRDIACAVGRTSQPVHYRIDPHAGRGERSLVSRGWLSVEPRKGRTLTVGPRFAGIDNRDDWPLELVTA